MLNIRTELDKLQISHPDLIGWKTYLTAGVAASASSSTVENNDKAATNDYAFFGEFGEGKAEIVKLTSTTGNTTLGHTTGPVFAHSIDDPIREIGFNQVEISECATEDGTYAVVATIDLSINRPYTEYTGTVTYWYKIRYKNEQGTTYSALSPAVQLEGFSENTLGYAINECAIWLDDEGFSSIKWKEWRGYARAGVIQVSNGLAFQHIRVISAYDTQIHTSGTATYDYPDRFIRFNKVDVAFGGSTYYRATPEDESEEIPGDTYNTNSPIICPRGGQYVVKPTPTSSSGVTRMWYEAYPTVMNDQNDTHGLRYGAHIPIIEYMKYKAKLKEDREAAPAFLREFGRTRDEYVTLLSEGFQDYELKKLRGRAGDLAGLESLTPTDN